MKEGWKYKKLGEVIDHLRTGLNPRTHFKLNTPDADCYYITVRELKGFSIEPDEKTDKVNSAAIKRINERSNLKPGDVLFSGTGTIGKTALVKELPVNWNIKEGVYAMTPKHSELDSKYLIYFIGSDSFLHLVNDKATGTGVRSIPMKELVKLPISVPPLLEQERIVERLDAAFAQIDELKSNAEKQLAEARALFQSALTQAMQPKPGWQEKTLKELSIIAGDYGLSVPSKPFDGVRYLRITDITEWGELNNELVSADISADDNSKEKLVEGDILFARTGATVGKTLVYKTSFGECLFAGYLIRYRLNKKEIMPQFMHYITHSKEYYDWVQSNQKAAAQPNINAKKYNSYIVKYPILSEQESIVTQLDALFAHIRELEKISRKTAAECDALKQALLRQIFE